MRMREWVLLIGLAALAMASCHSGSKPDASAVSVSQISPSGGTAQSAHYELVGTLGPSVDNSAASSSDYRLQAGLAGANIARP